jgi:hypothetical protein
MTLYSRPIGQSFKVVVALALGGIVGPSASAHPGDDGSIADARRQPLGTTVTVRGTVSVQTDAFDPGFAIQSGGAGIYVLDSGERGRELGDRVEVTGVLVETFGLLAIDPSSIVARGHGRRVQPREQSTGSVGEGTEGLLLELEAEMVGELIDDSPFGFKFDIDDGSGPVQVFLFPGSGVSTEGLEVGVSVRVVCFSGQFEEFIECNPRQPRDLEIEKRRRHGDD